MVGPFTYIMINQTQKYQQLASALGSDQFEGGYMRAAAFYFKNLQHLDADLLLNELEIAEQQKQIRALEDKLGLIREEQRIIDYENRRIIEESSEEVVAKEFSCPHRDCGKKFQKQSGVKLHTLLVHSSSSKGKDACIFKLQLRSQQNLA